MTLNLLLKVCLQLNEFIAEFGQSFSLTSLHWWVLRRRREWQRRHRRWGGRCWRGGSSLMFLFCLLVITDTLWEAHRPNKGIQFKTIMKFKTWLKKKSFVGLWISADPPLSRQGLLKGAFFCSPPLHPISYQLMKWRPCWSYLLQELAVGHQGARDTISGDINIVTAP